jgi:gliding motility-associated lipoprotein GldH
MRMIIACMAVMVAAASCNTLGVYEQTTTFPSYQWKSGFRPSFTLQVTDTSCMYNLYVVVRHEDGYHYKDIWLNVQVKDPDSTFTIRREFVLADNTKWLGSSMDDVIDHRMVFNPAPLSLKKGVYTFMLTQLMREDPLQHILNAGIRVEKVTP